MTNENQNDPRILMTSNGMDAEWNELKDVNGIHDIEQIFYPDKGYDEKVMAEIRKDYRWTPACQRAFLEELTVSGSVTGAAQFVAKSIRAAYALRLRREGAAFSLGWTAAVLIARDRIAEMLMDRAIRGYEEFSQKGEEGITRRGRFDNKLSANMLGRLDRIAEREAVKGSQDAQVRLIMQDWEAYLDLIERGGKGSEAALFCKARTDDDAAMDEFEKQQIDNELAQISADEAAEAEEAQTEYLMEEEPGEAAKRMSVWWDEKWECWMTNFPLSPEDRAAQLEDEYEAELEGGEGCAEITEIGAFGHRNYRRTLTLAETAAHEQGIESKLAPWTEAAQAARDAWFGEKEAA